MQDDRRSSLVKLEKIMKVTDSVLQMRMQPESKLVHSVLGFDAKVIGKDNISPSASVLPPTQTLPTPFPHSDVVSCRQIFPPAQAVATPTLTRPDEQLPTSTAFGHNSNEISAGIAKAASELKSRESSQPVSVLNEYETPSESRKVDDEPIRAIIYQSI
jgi:hypothetical protein